MSLDELIELLPAVDPNDPNGAMLPTHTWLTYHASIQGDPLVSHGPSHLTNRPNQQTSHSPSHSASHSPSHRAQQARHDYEVLRG